MHNKAYTPGSSMCCHNAYTIQAAEKLCYYKKNKKIQLKHMPIKTADYNTQM